MNEEYKYNWASPDKSISKGILIRFVNAPPRYKGEDSRPPGPDLEGKTGVILAGPFIDSHEWGGVFTVHAQGKTFNHWGDFMEVVQ